MFRSFRCGESEFFPVKAKKKSSQKKMEKKSKFCKTLNLVDNKKYYFVDGMDGRRQLDSGLGIQYTNTHTQNTKHFLNLNFKNQ